MTEINSPFKPVEVVSFLIWSTFIPSLVKSSLLSPLLVPAQIILLAPADTWSTKISVMKLLVNTLLLVAVLL